MWDGSDGVGIGRWGSGKGTEGRVYAEGRMHAVVQREGEGGLFRGELDVVGEPCLEDG